MNKVEALSNTIDAMIGEISERGWEGMDRYWKNPFGTFIGLLEELMKEDREAGLKMEKMASDMGIIELDEKYHG